MSIIETTSFSCLISKQRTKHLIMHVLSTCPITFNCVPPSSPFTKHIYICSKLCWPRNNWTSLLQNKRSVEIFVLVDHWIFFFNNLWACETQHSRRTPIRETPGSYHFQIIRFFIENSFTNEIGLVKHNLIEGSPFERLQAHIVYKWVLLTKKPLVL